MKNFVFTVLISLFFSTQMSAQVQVGLPDLVYSSPIGTIIEIPVSCGNLTGLNVIAYQFSISFNSNILVPESPYYSTTGTLSSKTGWSAMANPNIQNQLTIGAFGSAPLTESGVLLKLIFKVAAANGASTLYFSAFLFNAGSPAAILDNGSFINQDCTSGQTLVIPAGWSGISAYISPFDSDMVNMFAPIQSKLSMVSNFTNQYSPIFGIPPSQPWDSNSGYFIKLTEPAQLQICGQEIQNKVVTLTAGWNLVPVVSNNIFFIDQLLSGLNFEIVKEVASIYIYWPSKNIQTLDFFEPGKSYLIKMNSPGSIIFP